MRIWFISNAEIKVSIVKNWRFVFSIVGANHFCPNNILAFEINAVNRDTVFVKIQSTKNVNLWVNKDWWSIASTLQNYYFYFRQTLLYRFKFSSNAPDIIFQSPDIFVSEVSIMASKSEQSISNSDAVMSIYKP